MAEVEVRMSPQPICDFCSEANPTRQFECGDFAVNDTPGLPDWRSRGGWAACATCGALIDREKWVELQARAVRNLTPKYVGVPQELLAYSVRRSHDLFRKHYRKPR